MRSPGNSQHLRRVNTSAEALFDLKIVLLAIGQMLQALLQTYVIIFQGLGQGVAQFQVSVNTV